MRVACVPICSQSCRRSLRSAVRGHLLASASVRRYGHSVIFHAIERTCILLEVYHFNLRILSSQTPQETFQAILRRTLLEMLYCHVRIEVLRSRFTNSQLHTYTSFHTGKCV